MNAGFELTNAEHARTASGARVSAASSQTSAVCLAMLLLALAGCSNAPARVEPPVLNPVEAGKAAITEYDTNHDGAISGAELDACPAIKSALNRYDTNGDGKVTAETIAARVASWQSGGNRVARLRAVAEVTLDGQPLVGATVRFEPEPFLGPALLAAGGTTGGSGSTVIDIAPPQTLGISYGLYKVRISKVVAGKETLPAKYNTNSELGAEIAPDSPWLMRKSMKFDLRSK